MKTEEVQQTKTSQEFLNLYFFLIQGHQSIKFGRSRTALVKQITWKLLHTVQVEVPQVTLIVSHLQLSTAKKRVIIL